MIRILSLDSHACIVLAQHPALAGTPDLMTSDRASLACGLAIMCTTSSACRPRSTSSIPIIIRRSAALVLRSGPAFKRITSWRLAAEYAAVSSDFSSQTETDLFKEGEYLPWDVWMPSSKQVESIKSLLMSTARPRHQADRLPAAGGGIRRHRQQPPLAGADRHPS